MNIALIIAGGKGQRMQQEIPKQFLNVNDKPVIMYTLEAFQSHPDIDRIGVVCVDGWHDILRAIILVHDAIRPMVSHEIISDCIVQCKKHGSAVSIVPCNTVALRRTTDHLSSEVVPRDRLALTQTPQAFPLKRLADAHRKALETGILNSIASCTLMVELGESVHFSIGAETNIKLTTPDDLKIFKALLALRDMGKDPWSQ